MRWQGYRVVLRLRSPLHVGHNKTGNVQRTRPYVTGRVLWGALTLRLTRDRLQGQGPASCSSQYDEVGTLLHRTMAFTYLYPTVDREGHVDLWPWDDEGRFRARFFGTYASTAILYPARSADEGTLHEVEFISPRALDSGDPVYLVGYVFARDGIPEWRSALRRIQLGGERGYGWGSVEVVGDPAPWNNNLFDLYEIRSVGWPPVLKALERRTPLLAHSLVGESKNDVWTDSGVAGNVEPLVGRETDRAHGRFGVVFSEACICFTPGSQVKKGTQFRIGHHGVWHAIRGDGSAGDTSPENYSG